MANPGIRSIDGRGGFGLAERMRARLKWGIALVAMVALLGWLWRASARRAMAKFFTTERWHHRFRQTHHAARRFDDGGFVKKRLVRSGSDELSGSTGERIYEDDS